MDELEVLQKSYQLMAQVDKKGQKRIIEWLVRKLNLEIELEDQASPLQQDFSLNDLDYFESLSQDWLTDYDKCMLTAGRLTMSHDAFTTRDVNNLLQRAGLQLSNATRTLSTLVYRGLLLQIDKKGRTKQAQRKFSISRKGVEYINSQILQKK